MTAFSNIMILSFLNGPDIDIPETLEYMDDSVGIGGVGSVFRITRLNGQTKQGLLLKIIHSNEHAQKVEQTISILHEKLNKRVAAHNGTPLEGYPELSGIPLVCFRTNAAGEQSITCLLMRDLSAHGFIDLAHDNAKSQLIGLTIEKKLDLAYQFARVIAFLHQLDFIHADIKEASLFVNLSDNRLCLIDYDGGYHPDRQKQGLTLGALNAWFTAKWNRFLGKDLEDSISSKERKAQELWAVANGIFDLIFSVFPFFFLKDVNEEVMKNYFAEASWPSPPSNRENMVTNETTSQYLSHVQEVLKYWKGLDNFEKLAGAFQTVFNDGHYNEDKRLPAATWAEILKNCVSTFADKPQISSLSCNVTHISRKNQGVFFNWTASRAQTTRLNGVSQFPLDSLSVVYLADASHVELVAINEFGVASKSLFIDAKKITPRILSLRLSSQIRTDLTPIKLEWETENTTAVALNNRDLSSIEKGELILEPDKPTKYIFKAIGNFGEELVEDIFVDVALPKIHHFNYHINIEKGIDNIDLTWSTENALQVKIEPFLDGLDLSGEASILINERTPLKLVATGHFGNADQTIYAQPFPIPLLKELLVPMPTLHLETPIPEKSLDLTSFLNKTELPKIDLSIKTDEIKKAFVELEEGKLKLEYPWFEAVKPTRITKIFTELFNKIYKN